MPVKNPLIGRRGPYVSHKMNKYGTHCSCGMTVWHHTELVKQWLNEYPQQPPQQPPQPPPTQQLRPYEYQVVECDKCGKSFTTFQSLTIHKRTHTKPAAAAGQKSFKCSHCDVVLSGKTSFDAHERTHTKLRPFPCDVCDKTFNTKQNCMRHKYAKH